MSQDAPSVTGKRWFHALVVVGASLTGGAGCGSRHGLAKQDAGHLDEAASSADSDVIGDVGSKDSNSTDGSGSDATVDAGAEPAPDAIADARVEFPLVLIP
jgi:hypothetical protein